MPKSAAAEKKGTTAKTEPPRIEIPTSKASPKQPELEQQLPMMACPKCARKSQLDAQICPLCKSQMPAADVQDARNAALKSETEPRTTPAQREQINVRPPLAGSFRQTAHTNRQSA